MKTILAIFTIILFSNFKLEFIDSSNTLTNVQKKLLIERADEKYKTYSEQPNLVIYFINSSINHKNNEKYLYVESENGYRGKRQAMIFCDKIFYDNHIYEKQDSDVKNCLLLVSKHEKYLEECNHNGNIGMLVCLTIIVIMSGLLIGSTYA